MEDSYSDHPAVKDEMCSHYLTIRTTWRHAERSQQRSLVQYCRHSECNDGEIRRRKTDGKEKIKAGE